MRSTLRTGVAAILLLLPPIVASDAQQPLPQPECAQVVPVCALKNGTRQTYWNACQAVRDGGEFLYIGECRIPRSPG